MFNFRDVLKLRLARPSERYARVGGRSNAFGFAEALAMAVPTMGAEVFLGGRRGEGYVVTLGHDPDAAVAAGAGRMLWHARGEKEVTR